MQYLYFLLLVLSFSKLSAQHYKPDNKTSDISFTIKNMGLTVNGHLSGIKGDIYFNPTEPGLSTFKVQVDAASINTNVNARDNHLRKPEYLSVDKFPGISFQSTKTMSSGKRGEFILTGMVTIKGIEKEISFPFTAATGNSGSLLFKGQFKLNRRDFTVGGSSLILSDNLVVSLSINTIKENQ